MRADHHHDDELTAMMNYSYCFTSNRLAADQLPGVPEDELARTRHHILVVGSVLVVKSEAVVSAFTTSGVVNVSESSIWIV